VTVPFESGMGLMVTIVSSVVGLQQPTQMPGVLSTVETRNKKTDPAGRHLYLICEDEGKFPRVQEKKNRCLTTYTYWDLKCPRMAYKHTFMGCSGPKRTEVPYCP